MKYGARLRLRRPPVKCACERRGYHITGKPLQLQSSTRTMYKQSGHRDINTRCSKALPRLIAVHGIVFVFGVFCRLHYFFVSCSVENVSSISDQVQSGCFVV
jgi:hypothetical protein